PHHIQPFEAVAGYICPRPEGARAGLARAPRQWQRQHGPVPPDLAVPRVGAGQTSVPSLDEEIDLLADVLARQEAPRPHPLRDGKPRRLIVVCTVAGISALMVAAVCWGRLQKEVRLAQKADYSAQRVASPLPYDKISPGDKTLAQSAQMYHYQHQKQQMLSMEKHKEEPKLPDSASSDEENEDGDFTVYECPGLAPGSPAGGTLCAR
ncbi:PREDICTED: neural proliferation differentiation and control protein 1, partial [Tauraco erythrolophus]|uniref:neural proliferation differentiation and control protein 1 n=1 Tax=Tauraco erythrolophus TaxID=121530 RepID=UPI0005239BC9